jgi:hypothetical protein
MTLADRLPSFIARTAEIRAETIVLSFATKLISVSVGLRSHSGGDNEETRTRRTRVARLEAKEEVLSAFNQYLYGIDTGFKDDILDIFAEDAVLDVPNFPPEKQGSALRGSRRPRSALCNVQPTASGAGKR